jgi:heme/copper-type cytochrome/quinol oxidase subunit 2
MTQAGFESNNILELNQKIMKKYPLKVYVIGVAIVIVGFLFWKTLPVSNQSTEENIATSAIEKPVALEYKNNQYGFTFTLPVSWTGYTIINDKWTGYATGNTGDEKYTEGLLISIRHPLWTETVPRQDIPIMVFTLNQWQDLQNEKFHIGAAPIGPSELGRNTNYVFALPARYNYAFPVGYEEVDQIISNNSLQTF